MYVNLYGSGIKDGKTEVVTKHYYLNNDFSFSETATYKSNGFRRCTVMPYEEGNFPNSINDVLSRKVGTRSIHTTAITLRPHDILYAVAAKEDQAIQDENRKRREQASRTGRPNPHVYYPTSSRFTSSFSCHNEMERPVFMFNLYQTETNDPLKTVFTAKLARFDAVDLSLEQMDPCVGEIPMNLAETDVYTKTIAMTALDEESFLLDFSEDTPRFTYVKDGQETAAKEKDFFEWFEKMSDENMSTVGERCFFSGYLKAVHDVFKAKSLRTIINNAKKCVALKSLYQTYGNVDILAAIGYVSPHVPGVALARMLSSDHKPSKALGMPNSTLKMVDDAVKAGWLTTDPGLSTSKLLESYGPQIVSNWIQAFIYDGNNTKVKRARKSLCYEFDEVVNMILLYAGPKGKSYDVPRLFQYLTEDISIYQGINDPNEGLTLLRDYYKMTTDMGEKITEWFPRSLKLVHDVTANNYELKLDEIQREKFSEVVNADDYQRLAWSSGDWAVLIPQTPDDIVEEGRRQSHCVGSYVNYVIAGDQKICFLRKSDDPDKPVITLDVNKKNVLTQYRGFGNRAATDAEMKAIRMWAKERGLKVG